MLLQNRRQTDDSYLPTSSDLYLDNICIMLHTSSYLVTDRSTAKGSPLIFPVTRTVALRDSSCTTSALVSPLAPPACQKGVTPVSQKHLPLQATDIRWSLRPWCFFVAGKALTPGSISTNMHYTFLSGWLQRCAKEQRLVVLGNGELLFY